MLPEGWSVLKLDDVVTKTQLGTTERGTEDKSSSNSIPLIKMGNLGWGSINFKKVEMIDKSYFDESLLLERGDFLFNTRNTPDLVGKSAVWLEDYPATFDNNINRISFKPVINSYYISYYLNNGKGKSLIQALPAGSTSVAAIYWKDLKNIKLVLPPLPEQKKIAQILSTWDNAISATERLLENSQQRKKALMQQLLTGKKRLPGFEGGWEEQVLSVLCSIKTGKKDVNEGNPDGIYPFFTCANEPTWSDSYSYDCEALLIAGNGMLGRTHYYNGKFEAYQRTYILSDFQGVDVSFLHQYILFWLMRDIEREKQHGAMPYIKLGLLQNFRVFKPDLKEQQAIANVLTTADQEIDALQKRLGHLKLEKKALMQQLLTGKRRVLVDTAA